MRRPFAGWVLLLATLSLLWGCAKSGATPEEKEAALAEARKIVTGYEGVGSELISEETSHGKMELVIKDGIHPQKQAEYLQRIGMTWYDAYPEGKKPTINDMVQVWLYVNDKALDEVGFVKVYADEYGKLKMDFHHYKTQQAM